MNKNTFSFWRRSLMLKPYLSSFQNGLICLSIFNGCRDTTRRSRPLRALFGENVWENWSENRKFSHKRTKIWESTGPFAMKLGRYVHPMVLQKLYAGIVKNLIFRPVASHEMFKFLIFCDFWTFCAVQPAEKWKYSQFPHNVFVGPWDEHIYQVSLQMAQ